MTQPQRNEERLLDYLYGELEADARAQVEAELENSPTLRQELESHRRVRSAFAELPKPQQAAESTQRMTALLMQQAAQQAAAAKPTDPALVGGGKLLAFRSPTLRRVFTNPATGIFAAAAAALIWVAVKSQSPPLESVPRVATALAPSAPTVAVVPPAATPLPGTATPATDAVGAATTIGANRGKGVTAEGSDAKPQVWAQLSRSAASSSLAQAPTAATRPDPSTRPPEKSLGLRSTRDKAGDSLDGKVMALNDGYGTGKAAQPKLELAKSKADRALDDYRKEAESPPAPATSAPAAPTVSAAPAPSPPVDGEGGVRGAIAQTRPRRAQRMIEELANQELGSLPSGGAGARPSGPPPPPAAPSQEPERYAQNDGEEKSAATEDEKKNSYAAPPRAREQGNSGSYAQNQVRQQTGPAQRVGNSDSDRGNLPLLQAVQDYLRQGRCADANAALIRVEQSFPATRGLAEARAQWQKSCGSPPQQQAMPAQERQMMAQPTENHQPVPMAAPSPINRAMKKAAPARAKPTPSKAADSAVAY